MIISEKTWKSLVLQCNDLSLCEVSQWPFLHAAESDSLSSLIIDQVGNFDNEGWKICEYNKRLAC